jgi:hypothetical protein
MKQSRNEEENKVVTGLYFLVREMQGNFSCYGIEDFLCTCPQFVEYEI